MVLASRSRCPVDEQSARCISNIHFIRNTHIEPISAMEVFTQRNPIHAKKNIQMSPAVPPLTRPMVDTLLSVSDLGEPQDPIA